MAAQYTLTGAWTEITETSGTAQNVGYESVELVSDTNREEGEGITLLPGEKQGFNGSMYARSKGDGNAILNVVDFKEVAGGGDSYVLPAANASVRGGVKIGTGVEMSSDVLNLSTANDSVIGGVKSSDDDLDVIVRNDGTMYVKVASNAAAHNGIYRGKDLTAYFNSGDMSTAIANGTFDDIYIGDYIIKTINLPAINYTDKAGNTVAQEAQTFSNVKWYVAGLDIHRYYGGGGGATRKHHVCIIAAEALQLNVAMNPPVDGMNSTDGGYIGSDMWRVHMPNWSAAIKAAFGATHVLPYNTSLVNSVNNSAYSRMGGNFYGSSNDILSVTVEVNIPNEAMIFGCTPFSSSAYDIKSLPMQLPLFAIRGNYKFIYDENDFKWCWLSSISVSNRFCCIGRLGDAEHRYGTTVNDYGGIRPYFLLY